MPFSRKRLNAVGMVYCIAKLLRSVLAAAVRMEQDFFWIASFRACQRKGIQNQLCIHTAADLIRYHYSGKQVNNNAKIEKTVGNSDISNIAAPDTVGLI